jgi:threonyl-tRNA synthetase
MSEIKEPAKNEAEKSGPGQKPAVQEKLDRIRQSVSHVMAQAVTRLFPGTKVAIGPSKENVFYYYYDLPAPITAEDMPRIEAEMKRIIDSLQDYVPV